VSRAAVRVKLVDGLKDHMSRRTPEFCDFDCAFADFPPAETAGICRTMSAVWCSKLKELVNKNAPCEWRRRKGPAGGKKAKAKRRR
jgi:hypothetical protein